MNMLKRIWNRISVGILVFVLTFSTSTFVSLAASGDTTVYVTKTGECYHTSNCASLKKSKIEISLEEASKKYRACSKCKPPKLDADAATNVTEAAPTVAKSASVADSVKASTEKTAEKMVWLSATGSKYHSKNDCGNMDPNKASQVSEADAKAGGKTACSKCWK